MFSVEEEQISNVFKEAAVPVQYPAQAQQAVTYTHHLYFDGAAHYLFYQNHKKSRKNRTKKSPSARAKDEKIALCIVYAHKDK